MSDHDALESMKYVQQTLVTEIKENRVRQRREKIRSLTDLTLMMLTMMVVILCWMWLI